MTLYDQPIPLLSSNLPLPSPITPHISTSLTHHPLPPCSSSSSPRRPRPWRRSGGERSRSPPWRSNAPWPTCLVGDDRHRDSGAGGGVGRGVSAFLGSEGWRVTRNRSYYTIFIHQQHGGYMGILYTGTIDVGFVQSISLCRSRVVGVGNGKNM